jgi:hypothetical protein
MLTMTWIIVTKMIMLVLLPGKTAHNGQE